MDIIYFPFRVIGDALRGLLGGFGLPDWAVQLAMIVVGVSVVVIFAMLTMMFLTWLERKIIGRIQDRLGPNRTGPLGLLQPVADMVKLFTKEFIIPRNADKVMLTIDGQWSVYLQHQDLVQITCAERPLRLFRAPDRSFFDLLRVKLHWGVRE